MGTSSGEDDGEEGSGDDMDADHPPPAVPLAPPQPRPEPVVDEDGFTLVQGKGRRGGRR